MASANRIEGPLTSIASLEIPIDRQHGRVLASVVDRLQGSRKRKRSEIAVAIDTSGVKIFDVRNPRLLSSYHASHETYFLSPPCSIYQKKTTDAPAQRRTYAAFCNAAPGRRRFEPSQIECCTESLNENDLSEPERSTFTFDIGSPEVIALDILPLAGADDSQIAGLDVVATLHNGDVWCFDESLKHVRWKWQLSSAATVDDVGAQSRVVDFVTIVELKNALKGLLKGRQDIHAQLGIDHTKSSLPPIKILFIVSRSKSDESELQQRRIDLIALPQRSASGLSNAHSLTHLLAWDLQPIQPPSKMVNDASKLVLHASSGTLHILDHGSILTYDLSGLTPSVSGTLNGGDNLFHSFERISHNLLLATSSRQCGLYDIKYNAILDLQPFGSDTVHSLNSKKRKHLGSSVQGLFRYIHHFSELDMVVGLAANEVVAQEIKSPSVTSKRAQPPGARLVDVLRKGLKQRSECSTSLDPSRSARFLEGPWSEDLKSWKDTLVPLDAAADCNDVQSFEKIFASFLGIEVENESPTGDSSGSGSSMNGYSNGNKINGHHVLDDNDNDEDSGANTASQANLPSRWKIWSSPPTDKIRYHTQASYALGKMFQWTDDGKSSTAELRIRFFPSNVYHWLLSRDLFSAEHISQAIRRSNTSFGPLQVVSKEAIVNALVSTDPSLQSVCDLLSLSSYLELELVLAGMKVLMNSLDDTLNGGGVRAITLPEPSMKQLSNGMHDEDGQNEEIENYLALATADLDHAESTLQHGMALRSVGLRSALTHLRKHAKQKVTTSLRKLLNTREIIFLIQILRIELADGGWTSRYVDAGPTTFRTENEWNSHKDVHSDFSPADGSVTIVAGLLSCAIDAIGVAGWMWAANQPNLDAGRGAEEEDTVELLTSLRNEISAALQGIHEIKFIREFLAEYLRYSELLKESNSSAPEKPRKRNRRMKVEGGLTNPVTVRDQNDTGTEGELQRLLQAALPLGTSKLMDGSEKTKTGSGGVTVMKSVRERGMEKSKRVGKYTFERIRI